MDSSVFVVEIVQFAGYYGFQMPEPLEHAKGRALTLNAAGKPIEAICVMLYALRGLGVDPLDIANELALLQAFNDGKVAFTDGVRQWVSDLQG